MMVKYFFKVRVAEEESKCVIMTESQGPSGPCNESITITSMAAIPQCDNGFTTSGMTMFGSMPLFNNIVELFRGTTCLNHTHQCGAQMNSQHPCHQHSVTTAVT